MLQNNYKLTIEYLIAKLRKMACGKSKRKYFTQNYLEARHGY